VEEPAGCLEDVLTKRIRCFFYGHFPNLRNTRCMHCGKKLKGSL